jgi:hypothetical protein
MMPARPIAIALMFAALAPAAVNAAGGTPDWPCVQRKVADVSAGQIWQKGEIPQAAKDLARDKRILEVVDVVAARRTPLEEVEKRIAEFAAAAGSERNLKLQALFVALLDRMNGERGQVISGIERYGRHQIELAERLRGEQAALDKLRADPTADQSALQDAQDQLLWDARIFDDRKASLMTVCEVPVLIEQRLGAVTRLIEKAME